MHGEYYHLLPDLLSGDREFYFRYLRMNPEQFEHILSLVTDKISKENTKFRTTISCRERLVLTLQMLATGISQQSLNFAFRIRKTTVSNILRGTCEAIYDSLKDTYLKVPSSTSEWLHISRRFEETWNFPDTVEAIDAKHIRIECPRHSGSLYYNYKGFYSFVLLAVYEANYCLTLFDLGQYGSNNGASVLANSKLGKLLDENKLHVAETSRLDGC